MAAPPAEELRSEFLLDPEVAFLNHGSFGACPRPAYTTRYEIDRLLAALVRELDAEHGQQNE